MEVCGDLNSDNLKNHPLTPLRILRGLIILLVFLSTAFMFLLYFSPIAALGLRLLSVRQSRKVISLIFGHWLALWPYLFETINGTTVVFSGDSIPLEKRVLLIANHRTEVDWMYLWNIALRKGCLGYIKYVLKSSLMRLPIFGWGFHVLEFIPVERKREVDEPVLLQMLTSFKDPQEPLWLALFPEGTDFTEEKCKKSQKFAAESGLPALSNVLLPKTRGFGVCLDVLHNSLDAVYDLTIAYKPRCPTFLDNVFGTDPSEVHIHVRRVQLKNIPANEEESSVWLMDSFQLKDKLLSDFNAQGQFPDQKPEEELSILKCIATFTVAAVSATVFTLHNHCPYTVWPGILSGNSNTLGEGGFQLNPEASVQLTAPQGWSGRFWARTGCNFDSYGRGNCITGDCDGVLKCRGNGAPPATLAEFTVGSSNSGMDFYDVSLVDGYNVKMGIKPQGGYGNCRYAGCVNDINEVCPNELRIMDPHSGNIAACKSACAAFNLPEFCCTGSHATPQTCSPTYYSLMFKNACPSAYSYAYDDASSTFTCTESNYLITFCPNQS